MITGLIKSSEGRIRVKVKGFRGPEQEVEAVIDTGFSGFLTLHSALVPAAAIIAALWSKQNILDELRGQVYIILRFFCRGTS